MSDEIGLDTYFDQHVMVINNCIDSNQCDHLIDHFHRAQHYNLTVKRDSVTTNKMDEAYMMNPMNAPLYEEYHLQPEVDAELLHYVSTALVPEYLKKYPVPPYDSRSLDYESMYDFEYINPIGKLQMTLPGEGYHIWHCEHEPKLTNGRFLAWAIFLNDVEEGGETEFLYQSLRFSPKKGQGLIWPAYFTHMHRGNPPLKGEKYIATGWISGV